MIQLKIYQSTLRDPLTAIFVDLYDTSPIKLTLSIEDITNAEASSVFSKTFRVPATRDNNAFFTNAYEIDGIDFDITQKKPADIIVDGAEFKQGHIRLQKIYVNSDQDRIDYELLFLGETRDFASLIGDARMCDLNMNDLLPPNNQTTFSMQDIEDSWLAYPETNTGNPSDLTAGLLNGNILFPLIDHGNSYSEEGVLIEPKITLGKDTATSSTKPFNKSAYPLAPTRFKPMIRARRLLQQIFEDAGYKIQKFGFLDSELFHQIYVSAFGNNAQVGVEVSQSNQVIFSATEFGNTNSADQPLIINDVVQNAGGNYNTNDNSGSNPVGGSTFTIPVGVLAGQTDSYYVFNMSAFYEGSTENSDYSNTYQPGYIELVKRRTGQADDIIAQSTSFNGNQASIQFDSRVTTNTWLAGDTLVAGDKLFMRIGVGVGLDQEVIENVSWSCVSAPGAYYTTRDLDCDYKQIDFVKDILTSFRLVLAPKVGDPSTFIVEPWQDYIGSGTTYDWSHKLVENKDFIIEPLFNTQSATIEFKGEEDEDYINKFHQDDFKHVHGWLRFNSDNELLKGNRKIEVGYAPTPVDQITTGSNYGFAEPNFILPQTHKHTNEGAETEHLPIKPKTRMLFYNGLQPITSVKNNWYATGSTPNKYPYWPLVSMFSEWPPTATSLKLEFSNDTRYFLPLSGYGILGGTLFSQYWSRYINSLYNKFSRRVTGTFILNNVDLQDFSFNDVIFVNGKYYRPEKIIDVEVGASDNTCKVQLITLKDQRPVWLDEPLTGFSVVTSNTNCTGAEGTIQVTTNGTPDFTWALTGSGQSGTYSAPSGQAPYIFQITAAVGSDTLTVTDSIGRQAIINVTVPASTTLPITTSFVKTDPTICSFDEGQCNGSINVTVNNAVAPAITYWLQEQGVTGNTRTNLCEGIYQYYVVDANGCESDVVTVTLNCNDGLNRWNAQRLDLDCLGTSGEIIVVSTSLTLSPGEIVELTELSGCWELQAATTAVPVATIANGYQDCALCQANQPDYVSWKVESCTTVGDFQYVPNNTGATLSPGLVIEITNAGAANGCYTVIEESIVSPTYLVTNVFQDCITCETPPTEYIYFIEACDGSFGTYATSTLSNITLGSTMQITPSGTCVTVGQLVTGETPVDVLDDTTFYTNCDDCNGIVPTDVCTYVTGTSPGGSNGTYTAAGFPFNWSVMDGQTIVLCASNFVIISGTVTTITGGSCGVKACPPPEDFYKIENCEQQLIGYAEQDYLFALGDVVQYQINGVGATYCGTIIDTGFFPVTPDYVLAGPIAYECDDIIHCAQ